MISIIYTYFGLFLISLTFRLVLEVANQVINSSFAGKGFMSVPVVAC